MAGASLPQVRDVVGSYSGDAVQLELAVPAQARTEKPQPQLWLPGRRAAPLRALPQLPEHTRELPRCRGPHLWRGSSWKKPVFSKKMSA